MKEYRIYMKTNGAKPKNHRMRVNEDRFLFSEYRFMEDINIKVLVVADGMGGMQDGDKAAGNAVRGFSRTFYDKLVGLYMENDVNMFSISCFAEKLCVIVKEAFKAANDDVCKKADAIKPTGTTCSVVCIAGGYAVAANVGDSPIYYYHAQPRELRLISKLQTEAELDVEAGRYERYSPEYYANSNVLYQSLGAYSSLDDEDIFCCVLGKICCGDMFLLGTDGAFGRWEKHEILELLDGCGEGKEGDVLSKLFERAREDTNDDQTAILYVVSKE